MAINIGPQGVIDNSAKWIGDPTGLQGPKGDTGPKGNTGDKGDKGFQGNTGDKGDKGNTGDKGDKGETGAQGYQGDTGPKGNTGDKGDDSTVQGDTGPQGDTGEQGDTGAKGDDGAVGFTAVYTTISHDSTNLMPTYSNMSCPNGNVGIFTTFYSLLGSGANSSGTACYVTEDVQAFNATNTTPACVAYADVGSGTMVTCKCGALCTN